MKVIKFERDSVLVKDNDIEAWMDVLIDEHNEINCDWNEYIFITSNDKDMKQKEWQSDPHNFDEASSLAITTLEKEGFIYQDENGKWFEKETK